MTLKYNQVADALAKLKFPEQGSDPTPFANDGYLYAKDYSGRTELVYMNDLGQQTQITKDGYMYVRGGILTPPTETLTLLGLVPTADLPDGTLNYVRNVDDIYCLKKTGSYTPDGYDVVAGSGGGYWVSRVQGRWDDMLGDVSQGVGTGALSYDAFRDTPWSLYCMRHDQDDSLSMRFQFSHRWRPGTVVVPHLHVIPLADPAGSENAYFDGYYAWSDGGTNAVPAMTGWTRVTKHLAIDPGDVYKEKFVDLGQISPPSTAKESSILLLYIRRAGTSPGDTYTTNKSGGTLQANLGLLSVDVHFRANKAGSLPEKPT